MGFRSDGVGVEWWSGGDAGGGAEGANKIGGGRKVHNTASRGGGRQQCRIGRSRGERRHLLILHPQVGAMISRADSLSLLQVLNIRNASRSWRSGRIPHHIVPNSGVMSPDNPEAKEQAAVRIQGASTEKKVS